MLREWAGHLFSNKLSRKTFLEYLDEIIKSQIKMVLDSRVFPKIMRTYQELQFVDMPLLGLIATYTLNLIILRTILSDGEFIFDEQEYFDGGELAKTEEETPAEKEGRGMCPWDKLTQIWRSWFKVDNLSGLCAILFAERDGDKIILKARNEFRSRPVSGQLSTVISVAAVLADDATVGLAGLHSKDADEKQWLKPDELKKRLDAKDIDLSFEFIVRRLRQFLATTGAPSDEGDRLILDGIKYARDDQQPSDLIFAFFDLLFIALRQNCLSRRCEEDVLERLFSGMSRYFEMGGGVPELQMLRLLREFGGDHWGERVGEKFFERAMHPERLMEMMERRPEIAFEWLRLAREFGGDRWRKRFGEEFFERFKHPKRMHSERLMEMVESRPEIAFEWLRLAREFGGDRWRERFGEEFFERFMHPKRLMEMMKRRPEIAIEWLRLVREFGGGRWRQRFGEEFFERMMHPKRLMEIMEMRPEVAIEWLRLAREFGGDRWRQRFGEEFFERFMHPKRMHPERLMEMMERRPEIAFECLRIAREFGGDRWLERFGEKFFERAICQNLSRIPLEYVRYIEWYVEITHNVSLMEKIQTYIRSDINR